MNKMARILNIARFSIDYKRQDLLLRAVGRNSRLRELCHLRFVGGSGEHRWMLESMSKYFGLGSNQVEFVDATDDPFKLMSSADLFALPSASEGMAFAMVEAAASCRPLLATDVAGASELVIEGDTGYLAPAPTESAVEGALLRAIDDRRNWPARGKKAFEVALSRHCLADYVPTLAELHRKDIDV
jgi:glycosyltransferase involved in cell wall biosynthesis